jgi:hypothetical protein
MSFIKKLKKKQTEKSIAKEYLLMQTSATIEDILQNYFNCEDIDFRGYEKQMINAYNYIYKFTSFMKEYCEKNVSGKYIARATEEKLLDDLTTFGKIKDSKGFNVEFKREFEDMLVYYSLIRIRDIMKKNMVDNTEIKNKFKIFNMKISEIIGIFDKELAS